MNPIWKETIVDCPIHGKRITKIPIFQQNPSFNTKYYAYQNTSNYYSTETEPSYANNSSYMIKNNTNRNPYINYNMGRNQAINNNVNKNISLSNAYKSSLNNPIRIYGNGNAKYEIKSNVYSSRNKPVNVKNSVNSYRINDNSRQQQINSYKNKNIIQHRSYNKLDINQKESKAFYRRRNENNLEQKKFEDEGIYNRSRKNKYSYDLKDMNKLDPEYINKTYNNINITKVPTPRQGTTKLNNGIKKYSCKTNDVINKRIIITEPRNISERNKNSMLVNTTDLNNYKFYISRDNYLNNNNKIQYSMHTQPVNQIKRIYSERNPYNNILRTDYNDDYDYNESAYYEINQYMNKMNDNKYNMNYGYNDNRGLIKYNRSSPIYNDINYSQYNKNSVPIMQRKYKKIKLPHNTEINEDNFNNIKKKKKILKFKVHDLKELRENEFKIEKSHDDNKEKDDENVEEHVEKYFDKDGNCIGGKKIIIKQEYDNGQKIIKKFVEEKYKQDSDYEILKKQGENNYGKQTKNQVKKETIITSTIKSSNNDTIEANQEENNNINTIVTFGINSKKEDDLDNTKEEKEADEQNIEVNSEFEEEEIEEKIEENKKIEEKNEIENNEEFSKSPEEDNNSAILEEMNKENGGISKEIKDINEVKNIQSEEENNLNKNIPQIEKEELADGNKENNM